jgi:tetratricopeptide (TPR) repeat protein
VSEHWSCLAAALLGNGQQEEAEAQFRRFLDYQNEHEIDLTAPTIENIGWAYYRLANHREAIASFSEALSRDPQLVSARFDMGLVFLCMGQKRLATDTYQTALDDLDLFIERRRHGLLDVATFDLDDARRRYSLDDEAAIQIRNLLTEKDSWAAYLRRLRADDLSLPEQESPT